MKKLQIDIEDIKKIIQSDWDDNIIRKNIGEFVFQKAIKFDKETSDLAQIKHVSEDKLSKNVAAPVCCRGHA